MIVAALLLAAVQAAPAAPAPAAAPLAPVAGARLTIETPIETIVADPKGKAVLDADLPTLATNPSYEMFKGMSLHQLQAYAPDKLTDALLGKVGTDLAAIR